MPVYRTALGKQIDMAALAAKNEKVRAVGNMRVNARGDEIDAYGKVIVPATEKVNQSYSRTVGNKSAQPVRQQTRNTNTPQVSQEYVTLNPEEKLLEDNITEDLEIEKIKAAEMQRAQTNTRTE